MTEGELDAANDEAVKIEQADTKLAELVKIRRSVQIERIWQRAITIMAIVLAGIALALGAEANGLANEAKDLSADVKVALAKFEAERDATRVAACLQFNDQQERNRDGNKAQIRVLVDVSSSGRPSTPEREALIKTFLEKHDAAIDESFPDRDCSPEGIEDYLNARDVTTKSTPATTTTTTTGP